MRGLQQARLDGGIWARCGDAPTATEVTLGLAGTRPRMFARACGCLCLRASMRFLRAFGSCVGVCRMAPDPAVVSRLSALGSTVVQFICCNLELSGERGFLPNLPRVCGLCPVTFRVR